MSRSIIFSPWNVQIFPFAIFRGLLRLSRSHLLTVSRPQTDCMLIISHNMLFKTFHHFFLVSIDCLSKTSNEHKWPDVWISLATLSPFSVEQKLLYYANNLQVLLSLWWRDVTFYAGIGTCKLYHRLFSQVVRPESILGLECLLLRTHVEWMYRSRLEKQN